jgi:hypothetical protein
VSKPPARSDSKTKLKPTRESATAKEAKISKSPKTTNASPPWVPIVGVTFLGLAVLFFMGLVVARMAGYPMPDTSLICIVLALTASIGSGFLGGSATASGQINVSKLTPVKFGVTGGIAVFVITLILCHTLYKPQEPPGLSAPEITKVDAITSGDRLNVQVEFSPGNLSSQDNLYAAIATDKEFKQPDEKLANFCRDISPSPCVISFSKPQQLELWFRFIVKTPEGRVAAVSKVPKSFKILK